MYSAFLADRMSRHGDHGASGWSLSVVPLLTPQFCRPMSLVSSIFGSDDDAEILDALYTIANVGRIL